MDEAVPLSTNAIFLPSSDNTGDVAILPPKSVVL
jgi:hypothetical protein